MPAILNLIENAHCVQSLVPATDAAGRTGDYANVKNAAKAYAVVHIDQANAAPINISLMQAKDAAGTAAKAVTALMRTAVTIDCAAASGDVLVEQAAAASYTTDAGVKRKIVVIEVDCLAALDQQNGFTWIAIKTGASNVANLTTGLVWLSALRYQEKPALSARV
jgi:hypothetical protein